MEVIVLVKREEVDLTRKGILYGVETVMNSIL